MTARELKGQTLHFCTLAQTRKDNKNIKDDNKSRCATAVWPTVLRYLVN